jgi:hypothetical protein
MYLYKTKQMNLKEWSTSLAQENIQFIPNYLSGLGAKPERLYIDMKHINLQKLAYKRETALMSGILINTDEDYVPARIRHKDKNIRVRVRLKGDWVDHLGEDKWSYRIRVRGQDTFWGMKEFSLHHPKTRNYIYEWVYQQALKREDVLALRYLFINLSLNGKNLGIYALEEHFDKRLLENNSRREGVIVRFNENLWWEQNVQYLEPFPKAKRSGYGDYLSSDIDAFQTGQIMADPDAFAQFKKAITLLEAFRRNELKTSKVFDIQKLSKFLAITDLMGAGHAIEWINPRFYYNPVTGLLEPIGFDADCGVKIQALNRNNKLINKMLEDERFQLEYYRSLQRVSDKEYVDSLLKEIEIPLKGNLRIIHSEYPYFHFKKDILYHNQRYIKTILSPKKALLVYVRKIGARGIDLDLGNLQGVPLKIIKVEYKDTVLINNNPNLVIKGKGRSDLVNYQKLFFSFPEDLKITEKEVQELVVCYQLLGTSRLLRESVNPWTYLDRNLLREDIIRKVPNAEEFEFLEVDRKRERILFKGGHWKIDKDLIIPQGFEVLATQGLKLDLTNRAILLSYSPLIFVGTKENPIKILSTDSSGQGILVLKVKQRSRLEHVVFENLTNPSRQGWQLTGAVTFYESPVLISHSIFKKIRCEDALNVMRTSFEISHTLFTDILSDAFDADFTTGKILKSSFNKCGNDAVDVSGSTVTLKHITISRVEDKGISAGEKSRMVASDIRIRDTELAVSSKDLSRMVIEKINLERCKVGFTAFQKKPEFGPASIRVTGLTDLSVDIPHLIEPGSTYLLNGNSIQSNQPNLKDLLYGVKYGKSSD